MTVFLKKKADLSKLDSYRNSRHFVEAVKQARQYERDKDGLVVIAGACQSHFEALIQAGANFASSPQRKMIHALDPVFIAEKVANTSFRDTINILDMLKQTVTGIDGIGGLESRGKMRLGLPKTGDAAKLWIIPH
jgi:spore coat assembly protein